MERADRPLAGRSVLLTRSHAANRPLRRQLETMGAAVVEMPAIEILPPEDPRPLEMALRNLDRYAWICLTSRNAAEVVAAMLGENGLPLPPGIQVGAVGLATAQGLEDRGIRVDCRPGVATGSALVAAILRAGAAGSRVLLPQGDRARPEVREGLEAGGVLVDVVIAYRTVHPPASDDALALARGGGIDIAVLSSPSALHGLLLSLGDNDALARIKLVCIGPTTASAVSDAGFVPAAVAPHPTLDGLVEAVCVCALET